jgi:uncharacterized protein
LILLGTVVNAVGILMGTLLGVMIPKISDRIKVTVLQGLGMSVAVIGLSMSLKIGGDILVMILSLVVGSIIGEWLDIEGALQRVGQYVERKLQRGESRIAEAFVTSSLIYCVGSMAILGSIQSGLENHHQLLYTKSMLDGFSSIIFASTLGVGVGLSAVPVFLYQGLITVLAHFFGQILFNAAIVNVVSATGGLLILGIGLNVLGILNIRIGNMLPALLIAAVFKWIQIHAFSNLMF